MKYSVKQGLACLLVVSVLALAGCQTSPATSGTDATDTPTFNEATTTSTGTGATTLQPSYTLEDVFAPTQGSTAVATTPMDPASVRPSVKGSAFLEVNNLFSDGAVLQRNVTVPVWGRGQNGKTVTVEFAGQVKTAVVQDGKWRVDLDAMDASTQNRQMVITCEDTVYTVNDVLVGEVWLAGGQSNMAMSLFHIDADLKRALVKEKGNDSLREFLVTIEKTAQPKTNVNGLWNRADTAQSIVSIGTVAYFFAKELQKSLGVPVGIVRSCESGTELELWVDTSEVEMKGYTNPGKPLKEETDYKAMIQPLFPYALKGMIWYQGEDNVACELNYASYQNIFGLLTAQYRAGFENESMPFIQVMLPKYIHPNQDGWKHFRYVQMEMQENLQNVYTAVTIDTGDAEDIHPKKDKAVVGARLAAIALDKTYHVGEAALSPVCVGGQVNGNTLVLQFENVSRGLIVNGTVTDLEVKDESGRWKEASATVGDDGTSLIITPSTDMVPTGVRYANVSVPSPSLYDKNGLPVAPFYLENIA